jgi:hypothetical protein
MFLCPSVLGHISTHIVLNAVGGYSPFDLFSGQKFSATVNCKGRCPEISPFSDCSVSRDPRPGAAATQKGDNVAPLYQAQAQGCCRKKRQATYDTCQPPFASAGICLELQGQLLRRPGGWDVGLLHYRVLLMVDILKVGQFSFMVVTSLAGRKSGAVGTTTLSTDHSVRDSNWRPLGSSSRSAKRSQPASWRSTPANWTVMVSVRRSFEPRHLLCRTISSSTAYNHDSKWAIFLNIGAKLAGKIMRMHKLWAALLPKNKLLKQVSRLRSYIGFTLSQIVTELIQQFSK